MAPAVKVIKPFLPSDWASPRHEPPEPIAITGESYTLIGQSVSTLGETGEVIFHLGDGGY